MHHCLGSSHLNFWVVCPLSSRICIVFGFLALFGPLPIRSVYNKLRSFKFSGAKGNQKDRLDFRKDSTRVVFGYLDIEQ